MIKKPKIALFSDLHLGLYGNSTEWHEIALKWADWIVADLKKKKITDIFFLGDFFHNRSEISVQTIHVASELIAKFKDFNLFMVIGNHDAFYKNRSDVHSLGFLKGHDNITIIDQNLEVNHPQALYKVDTVEEAIDGYNKYLEYSHFNDASINKVIKELVDRELDDKDTNLVCYCAPNKCHGDVIKKFVEDAASQIKWGAFM
jgi:predicted MPP superfamily phosphohydrolase